MQSLRSTGLWEKSQLIVFSDHGHEAVNKYFQLETVLSRLSIPEYALRCVNNGGALFLYYDDVLPERSRAALEEELSREEAVELACPKERAAALGLNAELDPDTFPDLILGLRGGWILDKHRESRSMHGYLPESHPRMDGFMIHAEGRSPVKMVKERGHLFDILQIAEDFLRISKIEKPADGSRL